MKLLKRALTERSENETISINFKSVIDCLSNGNITEFE